MLHSFYLFLWCALLYKPLCVCLAVMQRGRLWQRTPVQEGAAGRKTISAPAGPPALPCCHLLSRFSPGRHDDQQEHCQAVCTYISDSGSIDLFLTLILLSKLLCVSLMFSSLSTVMTSKKAQSLNSSRRSHTFTSSSSSTSNGSLQLLRSRVRCCGQTR